MLDEDEEHLASGTSRLINSDPSVMDMNGKIGRDELEWNINLPGQLDTQATRYPGDFPRKQHERHKPAHEEKMLLHKNDLPYTVPQAHSTKKEHTPPLDDKVTKAAESNNKSSTHGNPLEKRLPHRKLSLKDQSTLPPPAKCREPGCDKEFRRANDLTKHEKTHSRAWKCPVPTCKYHDYGWPTEKELDRHVADKHTEAPAMFECLFQSCPYKSKRESNCKQHMEKAHGWTYVRSKNNGKNRLKSKPIPIPILATPSTDLKLSDTLGFQLTNAEDPLLDNENLYYPLEFPSYDANNFDLFPQHSMSEPIDRFEVYDQIPSMNDFDFTSPSVGFPSTMDSTPITLVTPASMTTPHGPEDGAFKQHGLTSPVELLDEGFDFPATTLDSKDDFVLFPNADQP